MCLLVGVLMTMDTLWMDHIHWARWERGWFQMCTIWICVLGPSWPFTLVLWRGHCHHVNIVRVLGCNSSKGNTRWNWRPHWFLLMSWRSNPVFFFFIFTKLLNIPQALGLVHLIWWFWLTSELYDFLEIHYLSLPVSGSLDILKLSVGSTVFVLQRAVHYNRSLRE